MVLVGSILKNKSGWFLFVVSLGLSVATKIVLAAEVRTNDFQPKFCSKSTLHDTTELMKLLLAHTMVLVGSIWKNKSGWSLFVVSLGLSVATEIVLAAGVHH
jgi:glycerol uptake facilitator-like aquaporin